MMNNPIYALLIALAVVICIFVMLAVLARIDPVTRGRRPPSHRAAKSD